MNRPAPLLCIALIVLAGCAAGPTSAPGSNDIFVFEPHEEANDAGFIDGARLDHLCWLQKDSASLVRAKVDGWQAIQDVQFPSLPGQTFRLSPVSLTIETVLRGAPRAEEVTAYVTGSVAPDGRFLDGRLRDTEGNLITALTFLRDVDGVLVVHGQGWFMRTSDTNVATDGGYGVWTQEQIVAQSGDPNCPPAPWE